MIIHYRVYGTLAEVEDAEVLPALGCLADDYDTQQMADDIAIYAANQRYYVPAVVEYDDIVAMAPEYLRSSELPHTTWSVAKVEGLGDITYIARQGQCSRAHELSGHTVVEACGQLGRVMHVTRTTPTSWKVTTQ